MKKDIEEFTTFSNDDIYVLHEVLNGYLRALESTSSDHTLIFMDEKIDADTIHKMVSGINDKILSILIKVNHDFGKSHKNIH